MVADLYQNENQNQMAGGAEQKHGYERGAGEV
jgi:hypothetical protein